MNKPAALAPFWAAIRTIQRGAILSDCGQYRYQLWRIWEPARPLLMWMMLNPSTGDAAADDPTIRRLYTFTNAHGYGGFFIGNCWAFRTKEPALLAAAGKQGVNIAGPDNIRHLREMAARCEAMVYAWGGDGPAVTDIRPPAGMPLFVLGFLSSSGGNTHPRHPLYMGNASTLQAINQIGATYRHPPVSGQQQAPDALQSTLF